MNRSLFPPNRSWRWTRGPAVRKPGDNRLRGQRIDLIAGQLPAHELIERKVLIHCLNDEVTIAVQRYASLSLIPSLSRIAPDRANGGPSFPKSDSRAVCHQFFGRAARSVVNISSLIGSGRKAKRRNEARRIRVSLEALGFCGIFA